MNIDLSGWDVARLHSMCPPPTPAPPPPRTTSPWAGIALRSATRRDTIKVNARASQRAARAVLAARSARVHAREVLHRKLEAESASFWLKLEERKAVEALQAKRKSAKERAPWRPQFDDGLGMLTPSEQHARHRERYTAGALYAEGCALAGDTPPDMEGAEKEERQLANELKVERKMAIEYDTTECARRMHVLEHNERSLLEEFTGKRSTRPAHSRTRYHAPASYDEARVALNLLHDPKHGPMNGPSHGPQ